MEFQEFWFWYWIFLHLFNKIDFGFEIFYSFQKSWYWYWLFCKYFKNFEIDIVSLQIFSIMLILILTVFCQFQQSWFWYWYFRGISRFLILILKPKSHSCPSLVQSLGKIGKSPDTIRSSDVVCHSASPKSV